MIVNELLIIISIGAVDFVHGQCAFFRVGISPQNQKEILYQHNFLRQLISNGTLLGQPTGTTLQPLKYDRKLAVAAQIAASTCQFSHFTLNDERWGRVGQNMARGGATFVNSEPEWNRVIQNWFSPNRCNYFVGDENNKSYNLIASPNAEYIGCGYAYFLDSRYKVPSFVKLYVCNYGPG